MKLKYKINLVSLAILLGVVGAISAAGVVAINEVTYELNRKLLSNDLSHLLSHLQSARDVLKESGLAGVDSYVRSAQDEIIHDLQEHQLAQSGQLLIVALAAKGNTDHQVRLGEAPDAACLDIMIEAKGGSMKCLSGGKQRFFSFAVFPEWNWLIALSVTDEAMMEARSKFIQQVLLIVLASLALGVAMFLWFTNSVMNPIQHLVVATRKISEGNWDASPPAGKETGEVAELSIAFRQMSAKLAEMYSSLQRNLEEIRLSQKALQASEEKYRGLVELLPQVIFEADCDGKLLFFNRRTCEEFGYTLEDLSKGLALYQLFTPGERERAQQNVAAILAGAGPGVREYEAVNKDGRVFPVIAMMAPVVADGKAIGLRGTLVNITERKQMEEELLRIQKLESLGVLAGGIAHDFNNILTTILGSLSLAKSYLPPTDPVYENLEETERACHRAKGLTQQLLTFSRGGAPVKKAVAIGERVQEWSKFALRGSNVTGEFHIAEGLWPVEIDEGQINQVLNNLVINAVQAMPQGGGVKLCAENVTIGEGALLPLPAGKYVKLSLEDHGCGIPAQVLPKIFDPYFSTKETGSGLGLATAHSIIERHNGYITVDSQPDVRTVFHVYLPATEHEEPKKAVQRAPTIPGKGRILVMDDEDMLRNLVMAMLQRLGYEAVAAADGAEAVEAYKNAREPFAAVIMDLTVPGGMGGKEAIKLLQEFDPQVKAIVSSGYSIDPVMADFRSYGFLGVVSKPYDMAELSRVLHEVLSKAPSMP